MRAAQGCRVRPPGRLPPPRAGRALVCRARSGGGGRPAAPRTARRTRAAASRTSPLLPRSHPSATRHARPRRSPRTWRRFGCRIGRPGERGKGEKRVGSGQAAGPPAAPRTSLKRTWIATISRMVAGATARRWRVAGGGERVAAGGGARALMARPTPAPGPCAPRSSTETHRDPWAGAEAQPQPFPRAAFDAAMRRAPPSPAAAVDDALDAVERQLGILTPPVARAASRLSRAGVK